MRRRKCFRNVNISNGLFFFERCSLDYNGVCKQNFQNALFNLYAHAVAVKYDCINPLLKYGNILPLSLSLSLSLNILSESFLFFLLSSINLVVIVKKRRCRWKKESAVVERQAVIIMHDVYLERRVYISGLNLYCVLPNTVVLFCNTI